MVVDDEDALLCMVADLIEDLGHQPLLATDGREALEVLQYAHQPPALIITDMMMPRMNGVALAETLKRDARLHVYYIGASQTA
jgi:CheY-like chemotaxis protein